MKRRTIAAAVVAAALAVAAPARAQSADALSTAELATYPAEIDCNNPYYAQYCMAYANWLAQYYPAYVYGYGYGWYGYPAVDVAFGFGFFGGHRFVNFHHFAFAHGIGFRGRFHGGFHGGGGRR